MRPASTFSNIQLSNSRKICYNQFMRKNEHKKGGEKKWN